MELPNSCETSGFGNLMYSGPDVAKPMLLELLTQDTIAKFTNIKTLPFGSRPGSYTQKHDFRHICNALELWYSLYDDGSREFCDILEKSSELRGKTFKILRRIIAIFLSKQARVDGTSYGILAVQPKLTASSYVHIGLLAPPIWALWVQESLSGSLKIKIENLNERIQEPKGDSDDRDSEYLAIPPKDVEEEVDQIIRSLGDNAISLMELHPQSTKWAADATLINTGKRQQKYLMLSREYIKSKYHNALIDAAFTHIHETG